MRRSRTSGLDVIRALCLVFAAWPNCTRCCPNGSCKYAWEDCPSGCGSCGSSGSSLETPSFDAGSMHAIGDATIDEGDTAGTLAFVTTASGTFAVVTVRDAARFYRVDANELDEDPLMVRPLGEVVLGDPGRVVAHGGRAFVALAHGEVVAVDPLTLGVVDRQPTCASPGALAIGSATWVSCDPDVRAMVASSGAVAATDGTSWRALEGTLAPAAPASAKDVATLDDASAWIDGDDAWFHDTSVNPGVISRAVALVDVHAEHVSRRVLAVRTSSPSMLVFYSVGAHLTAGPIEPLAQ